MVDRIVTKALAGAEDILLGVGTEVQSRRGADVSITKINAANFPYDAATYLRGKIGLKPEMLELYTDMEAVPTSTAEELYVLLLGGVAIGDELGGLFYLDTADTATAADGVEVFMPDVPLNGRWKRLSYNIMSMDAVVTKLATIEAGATGDQSATEIKAAYESNSNTNAFTDADAAAIGDGDLALAALTQLIPRTWKQGTGTGYLNGSKLRYFPSKEEYMGMRTDAYICSITRGYSYTDGSTMRDSIFTTLSGNWVDVAYSESLDLYVAVKSTGTLDMVASSSDRTAWVLRTSGTVNQAYNRVLWVATLGLFVAMAGGNSTDGFITSSNGIAWTNRSIPSTATLYELAWSESLGILVVIGSSGKVFTSTDAITWTERTGLTQTWYDLIWSESAGLFVAVGYSSGNVGAVTSPDGITWTRLPTTAGLPTNVGFRSVAAAENFGFMLVAETSPYVYHSVDGLVWTEAEEAATSITGSPRQIVYSDEHKRYALATSTGNPSVTL